MKVGEDKEMQWWMGWGLAGVPILFWMVDPFGVLDAPGWNLSLHMLHLLFVLGIGLFLFLAGQMVLRLFGLLPTDLWEKIFLGTCTGFLISAMALFVFATLGVLHPLAVWGLAILTAFASTRWAKVQEIRPGGAGTKEGDLIWSTERMTAWGLGGLLSLLFLGSMVEALYPTPQSPDALSQNLVYPRLFLDSGRFRFTPENPLYFALSAYWELFLAGVGGFVRSEFSYYVMAQLLHLFLGLGGTVLGIICLVRRLAKGDNATRWALAIFGAALFVGMRPDISHVRLFPFLVFTAKSDLVVVALQMGSALVILEAIADRGERRIKRALLLGGLLGIAAGLKLTGGIAAIGLGAAFWLMPPSVISTRERLWLTGLTAAGVATVILPLFIRNWMIVGNPIYPLLASFFGKYENPIYFRLLSGFGQSDVLGTWWNLRILLFPSVPFFLFLLSTSRKFGSRGVHYLLLSSAISILVIGMVFSSDFPLRYALFITAFCAVAAACGAGGLIGWLKQQKGTGIRVSSTWAVPAAWVVLFILAVSPTHLDNRLKRAFQTAWQNPYLGALFFRMSPTSEFQSKWMRKLPAEARPLTFYRPEALLAVTRGWLPVVAVADPEIVPLFIGKMSASDLEQALAERGITHVYFESKTPVPSQFPLQPKEFVAHLRKKEPFMRANGFEMYAIGKTPER